MTRETYSAASKKLQEIESKSDRFRKIDNLIKRIKESSSELSNDVEIQIAEAWCYTPTAIINKERLIKFLDGEKDILINEIQLINREFANL